MTSVLIIGSGGREHALAWKMEQSPNVQKVFVVPGNGAVYPTADIDIDDADAIVSFCRSNSVSLVVIGPEIPLSKGIVDRIGDRVRVFGPTREGAMLETSKVYAKKFMKQFGLQTAEFADFNDVYHAEKFIDGCAWRSGIVVKADGLAAGKGVVVADTKEAARNAAKQMLQGEFGESSRHILVEEKLDGYEVSALCFVDVHSISRMPLIRDHKRLLENDKGPNTGGMGVVGPVSVSPAINQAIDETLKKTVEGLRQQGITYKGILYAGFMVTSQGPQLLEFNCRFGDPETQILMRLLDSDLFDVCVSCVDGTLSHQNLKWNSQFACGIVIASNEYPTRGDKGTPITHIPHNVNNIVTFQAGTAMEKGQLVTNGGRILCVTSLADSPEAARQKAVEASEAVQFRGKYFRRDIGVDNRKECTSSSLSYGDSGVDITEGNSFVEGIKSLVKATLGKGTGQIGGFGAVIDLTEAGFPKDAQLVVGIDGVGTKIEIASLLGDFSSVGFDVVGMCVNDVLCHCARPIAFLDYFVTGKLDKKMATEVVTSIAKACIESGCSLVGGETAEMPGVYLPSQWDLAGCAIAAREKGWPELPDMKSMCEGDVLIGLPSSGIHSNGFSLVRKVFSVNSIEYDETTPWDHSLTFGQVLLSPTRLYVRPVLPLLQEGIVKGCAHITGGGIEENAIRVLDKDGQLEMQIDASSWPKLPIFDWLAGMGPITNKEMLRTFNCGIGMVLVVSSANSSTVIDKLRLAGEKPVEMGHLRKRQAEPLISFTNLESAFNRSLYKKDRRRLKVAIIISGAGSNMTKLIEKAQRPTSNCQVVLVVSNKPEARGLEIAKEMGVETVVVPHTEDRVTGDKKLHEVLQSHGVELVCLAGYMRLLSAEFVSNWRQRIINIHPSLLPAFKGAHSVRDAIHFGARITGCTVHYVDEEMDHGPVICQMAVEIESEDTEESLHSKIQAKEHELFPSAMESLASMLLKM